MFGSLGASPQGAPTAIDRNVTTLAAPSDSEINVGALQHHLGNLKLRSSDLMDPNETT